MGADETRSNRFPKPGVVSSILTEGAHALLSAGLALGGDSSGVERSGSCRIDLDLSSHDGGAIEGGDGCRHMPGAVHRHEPEASRSAGGAIPDDRGIGDVAVLGEEAPKIIRRVIPGQVSNEQTHELAES